MRPGWTLDGAGPFPVWRWGALLADGPGPWLAVTPGHTCGNRWVRVYVGPDGRRHRRTGDCDDVALAMACAEVRLWEDDEDPDAPDGALAVECSVSSFGGAVMWEVMRCHSDSERIAWRGPVAQGTAANWSEAARDARLAAARILLDTAG